MGDPLRSLRHRAGFSHDVAALSRDGERELIEVVLGFIAEAISRDEVDVLDEWELAAHPSCFAIEVSDGEYLTLSIESESGETIVYLERAGGSEVLASPRRE